MKQLTTRLLVLYTETTCFFGKSQQLCVFSENNDPRKEERVSVFHVHVLYMCERLYPAGGACCRLAPCNSSAGCGCPAAPCCCRGACAAASVGWTSGSPWQRRPGRRIYSSRRRWALLLLHCHTKGVHNVAILRGTYSWVCCCHACFSLQ